MEVCMLPLTGDLRENKPYYIPLLLLISIVSHFPFVLNGFGEIDATKIAVSVIDMLNNGPDAAFANLYFSDVIPLYILYLKWSMKLLNYDYSYLPLVMNYTNAVFGVLIIVPAFILTRQLFGNPVIAFCSVLALILAPSFYQSTIMGFPHLISFFFLLVSLYFYLSWLDHSRKITMCFSVFLTCLFLTVAFLFKSDIVLATGIYIGFLFMRKEKDKGKIASAFLIIFISGVLFLLIRNLILGPSSGTTMSKDGLSKWYEYSLIIPSNISYLTRQTKPIAYGAGLLTFFLGSLTFVYYLFKRRLDVLAFILSWAAVPTVFWLVMIGNNARHNMVMILPLLVIIILFIYEKIPKYSIALTVILILGNFFITAPSFSILTPSGNLFKSNKLLEDRMIMFESRAKEIATINEDKIVVLGTFHNPHVIMELMKSIPSYEAVKLGREDYMIKTGDKEFVFLYFVAINPGDLERDIDSFINKYNLKDHTIVSATYDLQVLNNLGYKTRTFDIIERSSL
jgi:hypothetical protein